MFKSEEGTFTRSLSSALLTILAGHYLRLYIASFLESLLLESLFVSVIFRVAPFQIHYHSQ